jgi:flagellar biosynthesis protein FlhA
MDGASKFVRGDAMAGILITFINVIGGMIIGVAQEGITFEQAANSYTLLTVGDGIVSQIPALVVSVAAGMLVSKAGVDGAADKAIGIQLFTNPQGLAMAGVTAGLIGLLPGMPMIPFFALAGAAGYGAWRGFQKQSQAEASKAREEVAAERAKPVVEPPIQDSLSVDDIKIELGFGLLGFINETSGRKLTDQVKAVRRQIASEFGFVVPQVRIIDNLELGSEDYRILIKEVVAGRGKLRPQLHLAMDAGGTAGNLPGERVNEPVFGLPAVWIDDTLKETAAIQGYTIVDAATVLTTHFTELVKENMAELLTFGSVRQLIDDLPKAQSALVADIAPSQITISGIQRILQNLLRERISIRDFSTILEAIAEATSASTDLLSVGEHVRSRLGAPALQRTISTPPAPCPSSRCRRCGNRPSPKRSSASGADRQLALEPSRLHQFVADLRNAFERAAQTGRFSPVLLTSAGVRPYVRSLVERFRPQTIVMSQNEVHPESAAAFRRRRVEFRDKEPHHEDEDVRGPNRGGGPGDGPGRDGAGCRHPLHARAKTMAASKSAPPIERNFGQKAQRRNSPRPRPVYDETRSQLSSTLRWHGAPDGFVHHGRRSRQPPWRGHGSEQRRCRSPWRAR